MIECMKSEFLNGSYYTPQYLDSLVLGNYHEKIDISHIKYINVSDKLNEVRDIVK